MKNDKGIDLKLAKKLYDAYAKVANPDSQMSLTQNVLGHDVEYIFEFFHSLNGYDGYCDLEFFTYKASKEANKLFDKLDGYSFDIINEDAVYEVQCKLEKKLKNLVEAENQINQHLRDINISKSEFYECFRSLSKTTILPWVTVNAALNKLNVVPTPIEVKLNNSYVATIVPNTGNIRVGCQSIPVDAIREVLAKYDDISTK